MSSFASGSSHGLRYIKETVFGITPAAPAMKALRHTSCSIALNKDSFQSDELRRDAQISDLRHGLKQVGGDIGIELSYGEFDDFLAAAVMGAWDGDVLKAGITVPTFTIEREFADIGQFQLFTGCAVSGVSLDIKTNAMISGSISFLGKGAVFKSTTSADSETASLTHSPLDGFSGALKEGGTTISVITGISLKIDNGMETANVIGSDEAAQLVHKRINITGKVSAFFENLTLLNKFVHETESSLEVTFGTGGPGSYILKLPRIKYSGGSNAVSGEGPIVLDMPFQALLSADDASNIVLTRVPTP